MAAKRNRRTQANLATRLQVRDESEGFASNEPVSMKGRGEEVEAKNIL